MFRIKRNFSLIDSPNKGGSPIAASPSPLKRNRLISQLTDGRTSPSLIDQQVDHSDKLRVNNIGSDRIFSSILKQAKQDDKLVSQTNLSDKSQLGAKFLDLLANKGQSPIVKGEVHEQIKSTKIIRAESDGIQSDNEAPIPADIGKSQPRHSMKHESKVDLARKRKEELLAERKSLDEQIEARLNSIRELREKIVKLGICCAQVENRLEDATKIQNLVRDLLNAIYHPGRELSEKATVLIEDSRLGHKKRFEKFKFDVTNYLDGLDVGLNERQKQLEHEIELHKRTLVTLECQEKRQRDLEIQHKSREVGLKTIPENVDEDLETDECLGTVKTDDDCVVIGTRNLDEKSDASDPAEEVDIPLVGKAPNETHGSEATITCPDEDEDVDEDEQTEVDMNVEDDEERSFTPCQAQRPN